jgi:hypothetical protein
MNLNEKELLEAVQESLNTLQYESNGDNNLIATMTLAVALGSLFTGLSRYYDSSELQQLFVGGAEWVVQRACTK